MEVKQILWLYLTGKMTEEHFKRDFQAQIPRVDKKWKGKIAEAVKDCHSFGMVAYAQNRTHLLKTTNAVEGLHGVLKGILGGSLVAPAVAFNLIVRLIREQSVKPSCSVSVPLSILSVSDCSKVGYIARKALSDQLEDAVDAIKEFGLAEALRRCQWCLNGNFCEFRRTMEMPCLHQMIQATS
jgi:hypothetical protein